MPPDAIVPSWQGAAHSVAAQLGQNTIIPKPEALAGAARVQICLQREESTPAPVVPAHYRNFFGQWRCPCPQTTGSTAAALPHLLQDPSQDRHRTNSFLCQVTQSHGCTLQRLLAISL